MVKRLTIVILLSLLALVITHRVNPTDSKDKIATRDWVVEDSKAYAKDAMLAWVNTQYACLDKLWTKESHWNPEAYNKVKVMGKNAGGIPQLLGMSTKIPAPQQIDRGIAYIMNRYTTPCKALAFHNKRGWY